MNTQYQQPAVKQGSYAADFIRRFTFRRARLGSVLFALFAVAESLAQSFTIVKAYPDVAERARVITTLASNPALGLFYGDPHHDIVSAAGYMVYRILLILSLIGAVWMVMFVNKMLRGQEETGRWELLISGQASARSATRSTIAGALASIVTVYGVIAVLIVSAGKSPQVHFAIGGSLLYALVIVSGAVLGLGIGAIASQLAPTKRKANLYGVLAVVGFFMARAVSNAVDGLTWLKNITPFGWIEKVQPFSHAQPVWLIPVIVLATAGCWYAIWLSGKRDMGESLIPDTSTAKPRFRLLGSQLGFDLRANSLVLAGWLALAAALATIIAAIDKTVARSLTAGDGLSKTFSNLSGNPAAHIELAYLSASAYIVLTVLMIMITTGLGVIREEEASGRLENFVSGTVSRRTWLTMRLALLVLTATGITFLANLIVWVVVEAQGIHVPAATLLLGGFNILGPIVLLLGAGVLLFGVKPRLAAGLMYIVIAWSFTIDIVSSVLHVNKYLADTSLLHHTALVPAASPDWKSFAVMVVSGLVLMFAGLHIFQKRDLILE